MCNQERLHLLVLLGFWTRKSVATAGRKALFHEVALQESPYLLELTTGSLQGVPLCFTFSSTLYKKACFANFQTHSHEPTRVRTILSCQSVLMASQSPAIMGLLMAYLPSFVSHYTASQACRCNAVTRFDLCLCQAAIGTCLLPFCCRVIIGTNFWRLGGCRSHK